MDLFEALDKIGELTPVALPLIFGAGLGFLALAKAKEARGKLPFRSFLERNGKRPYITTRNPKKINGIFLGKMGGMGGYIFLPPEAEAHLLIIGPSGVGKTSCFLIPSIQRWQGTGFYIDIEGDIVANARARDMVVWKPSDPNGLPYNLFGHIDSMDTEEEKNKALEELAHLLLPPVDETASDASKYFNKGGRNYLTASLIGYYGEGWDFCDICRKVVSTPAIELFKDLYKLGNELVDIYIAGFHGGSEKNASGCKQVCDDAIRAFAVDPRLRETICRPKPGMSCITSDSVETNNVFAVVSRQELQVFGPLLGAISAQVLHHLAGRSGRNSAPILLALDEFTSLGRMDTLVEALQTFRKRNVRIMLCTQAISDIDETYGYNKRKSIMTNCIYQCVLGVDDPSEQKEFAERVGRQFVERCSTTSSPNGRSYTTSQTEEWIIPPSKLRNMRKKYLLLHPDGHIIAKKIAFFNRKWR